MSSISSWIMAWYSNTSLKYCIKQMVTFSPALFDYTILIIYLSRKRWIPVTAHMLRCMLRHCHMLYHARMVGQTPMYALYHCNKLFVIWDCILIYQGVYCCTKVCNLRVLRTIRVVIQPESSGWWGCRRQNSNTRCIKCEVCWTHGDNKHTHLCIWIEQIVCFPSRNKIF